MMKKLDLNSITISLIIPTLNAAEYMPGLIDILGRQTRKPDEIIVIDSESEDATVRMAEQAGFRTLKVKRSEFDHGGTRNYAVTMSKGDIVMFLSLDALPSDEFYVEIMLAGFVIVEVVMISARELP